MRESPAEKFRRADAVFDAALDIDPEKRAAFVEHACGADAALRADVDRLLRAHDRVDDFLMEPLLDALSSERGGEAGVPPPARMGVYRIERELGRGGMGVVYLAERDDEPNRDASPRVPVALKAVRTGSLGAGSMVRRFLAEGQILASLDHPNVARLLDAGVAADGTPYFAMEYCAGGSLADRLAAGGSLSLPEALDVARQLAAALGAAHAHGVVHRDVKPGNVLFDGEGRVRLSDFGIAKFLDQDSTRSGAVLGTVSYLAPEQLHGRPVDHRADLWALGVTLYEMLNGRRPFAGDSYAAVLHAVLTAEPAPLEARGTVVPDALRTLVARLLAKDPAARPQSAREVEQTLDALARGDVPEPSPSLRSLHTASRDSRRWWFAIVATLGVAAAGYGASRTSVTGKRGTGVVETAPVAADAPRLSVAVLPFVNTSNDSTAAPFADGLTGDLIGALGEVDGISVAGAASSFESRRQKLVARDAARILGAASTLEGTVERSRDHLRVTVRLVNAADGRVVWTETYDRDPRDIFAVRGEMVRKIVSALRGRLTAVETKRLAERPTVDAEAYDFYVRGLSQWATRSQDGLERALAYYQQAVVHDPTFALAYSGIADAYVNLSNFDYAGGSDALPRARAAAGRAVGLDSTHAQVYASLGFVLESQLALAPAESAFLRAIELNPRYVWAHHYYSLLLAMMDRPGEAREQTLRTLELDPLSPMAGAHLGVILCLEGKLDRAAQQLVRASTVTPSFPLVLYYLGAVDAAQGRYTDAIPPLQRVSRLSAGFPGVLAALAYSYRKVGRVAAADSVVRELRRQRKSARGRINVALGDAVLGEIDAAFQGLAGVQWDMPTVIELRADPLLARLRADPRYSTVLRNAGLPR